MLRNLTVSDLHAALTHVASGIRFGRSWSIVESARIFRVH